VRDSGRAEPEVAAVPQGREFFAELSDQCFELLKWRSAWIDHQDRLLAEVDSKDTEA
jgi:hypothetical protein